MSSTKLSFSGNQSPVTLGYLDVIELPSLGYCGGLLIVSQIGRPLAFHCSAPVAPNRSQQIMYGTTYQEFLWVDQISKALLDKTQPAPHMLLTQQSNLSAVSELFAGPVLEIVSDSSSDSSAMASLPAETKIGETRLATSNLDTADHPAVGRVLEQVTRTIPLAEPFERIAQAIEEAHAVLRVA